MPDQLDKHISAIYAKLQQFLKQHGEVVKENELLNNDLGKIKKENESQAATIRELKEQVLILKSAALSLDEKDKKELGKNIHHYIRTLDECMEMLNS